MAEKKIKVAIVEDEPALQDIYKTKLEMEGYEVVTASDGVEGLNTIVHEMPDLVLLDVVIPLKDGFQVLEDMKANPQTTNIPAIILSNLGQSYEIKRGLALGAKAFLTKANLTPDQIHKEIQRVLSAS
jgi:CheY-like chemotaxis protein